jgi:hypothetical protein
VVRIRAALRQAVPHLEILPLLVVTALVALAVQGPPGSDIVATGQAPPGVVAAWVELAPEGSALARAVTTGPACPPLVVAGTPHSMSLRAPTTPAFALPVCEAPLPAEASSVSIGGQVLPVPRPEPSRIVVIGDAGCRLEEDDPIQDCNDPRAWPFARVAASAAAWQPDLVIHVGDYLYREMACPPKLAACAGSPWGDNWAAWQADLFTPARSLLRAAPWVFTRGNHELCSRGGDGWFRLLDPRPYPGACEDYTEPYAVDLGDLRLVMLDSAQANDFTARPDQVEVYRAQFARVADLTGPNAWLVQHRPLWAIGQSSRDPTPAGLFRTNPTLQAASDNRLPAGVQLVVSGHIHFWEALTFADDRPPQVVVGNAGTLLDPPLTASLAGQQLGGTTVASGAVRHEWGFMTIERAGPGWLVTMRDVDGAPVVACDFTPRRLSCTP